MSHCVRISWCDLLSQQADTKQPWPNPALTPGVPAGQTGRGGAGWTPPELQLGAAVGECVNWICAPTAVLTHGSCLGAPRKENTVRLHTWPPGLILTSNPRPLHAEARDLRHWRYPLTMLTSPCVFPSGLFTHPFIWSADLHPYHCSHDLCASWVEVKTECLKVCERVMVRECVCVRK